MSARVVALAVVVMLAACSGSDSGTDSVVNALEADGVEVESCELYHEVQQLYRCQLSEAVDGDTDWCAVDMGDGDVSLIAPYRLAYEDCQ